jgi:hypothetical protein
MVTVPHLEEVRQLDHARSTDTRLLSFPTHLEPSFTDHRLDLENREGRLAATKAIGSRVHRLPSLPLSSPVREVIHQTHQW